MITSISQKTDKTVLCVLTAICGAAIPALAIPTSLDIDCRSPVWTSANEKGQDAIDDFKADSPWHFGRGKIDILNINFGAGCGNGFTRVWATKLFEGLIDEACFIMRDTSHGADYIGFPGLETKNQNPLRDVYVEFGSSRNDLTARFYEANPFGGLRGKQNCSDEVFNKVPDGGTTLMLLGIGLISLMAFRFWVN
jgi:hypothetical protein